MLRFLKRCFTTSAMVVIPVGDVKSNSTVNGYFCVEGKISENTVL
jgi:hypothetical protein